jgi:hypothetical protein
MTNLGVLSKYKRLIARFQVSVMAKGGHLGDTTSPPSECGMRIRTTVSAARSKKDVCYVRL